MRRRRPWVGESAQQLEGVSNLALPATHAQPARVGLLDDVDNEDTLPDTVTLRQRRIAATART